ncbi:hypothetical protein GRX01_02355 [Halobaculum sp. WSA2]|uniref:Uncharacterized protein n=1 Tax=Halobaculum saliterrae TaxID=2073113 RepID=A0A6B0SU31_9EURY|nr:hypothetical protein [Halobaculum saliterrae]MXR40201.1 hypothetical protein [Halobaculum saliterrae]
MTSDEASETDVSDTDDDTAPEEVIAGGDLLEAGIMVVSALLIVGLLGYIASQAIVAPTAAEPTATIDSVERMPPESPQAGRVRVTVGLENDGETGLGSVEVAVRCGSVERSLVFTHVPARGHRTGTVICPRGTTPDADVVAWIEA